MRSKNNRTLLLIAAVAVAPIVVSYAAYYLFPRETQANYGELLPTRLAPPLAGSRLDGAAFELSALRGKWMLLIAGPSACDAGCAQALYATRQSRAIQGRERERVQRVWLVTDAGTPEVALLAEHPDLVAARVPMTAVAALPAGAERIYLIDPLGNLVLSYSRDPDIKAAARDLQRLLRASRIG
ncbi:MAG: hypothetical protein H0T80_06315 [Betaproteobacteria bacterium]|nr:hypothetical protein [Betaproteobacteria bacterium]MBA3776405.1 hypothetical protein [Betaproteobacteria bacterium]